MKEIGLDTSVLIVTPERIAFRYPLAGPFRRALAYLFDMFIWIMCLLAGLIVSLLISLGSAPGMGVFLVLVFALQWGYGAFFEGLFNGQTPGKRVCGVRVISQSGAPITGAQAVLRNLTWPIEGPLVLAFLPALASMTLTGRFQRLGDLSAGTMVVVENRKRWATLVKPADPGLEPILASLPKHIDAGPEVARALSDFVVHRRRFGRDRREEMARHLAEPLIGRFGLARSVSGDLLLCAVYQRVFLGA